jgi:hypothetical protein
VWATTWPTAAAAQTTPVLPSPLSLGDVIRLASERRDEIKAARARTRAGEARPTIVSALQDPMISPSLDHLPFMLGGADVSFTIEQQIPLSGIRGHRRASALADGDRLRADASRTTLDVGIQAVNAFLMVQERRRTTALVSEQLAFARDVVSAANARYASGTAPQSDVLRAEVEVARFEAVALVVALLYLSMRGWPQTFLVLSSLPFALAGSVWLLAFMHYNLSTAVWVGLIAVAGVAAETGIVMVVYLDESFARYMREGRIQNRRTWMPPSWRVRRRACVH